MEIKIQIGKINRPPQVTLWGNPLHYVFCWHITIIREYWWLRGLKTRTCTQPLLCRMFGATSPKSKREPPRMWDESRMPQMFNIESQTLWELATPYLHSATAVLDALTWIKSMGTSSKPQNGSTSTLASVTWQVQHQERWFWFAKSTIMARHKCKPSGHGGGGCGNAISKDIGNTILWHCKHTHSSNHLFSITDGIQTMRRSAHEWKTGSSCSITQANRGQHNGITYRGTIGWEARVSWSSSPSSSLSSKGNAVLIGCSAPANMNSRRVFTNPVCRQTGQGIWGW